MRISIYLVLILLAFSKDVRYKIQNLNQQSEIIFLLAVVHLISYWFEGSRSTRDDTSTVWLQDFEGDLSDWTVELDGN